MSLFLSVLLAISVFFGGPAAAQNSDLHKKLTPLQYEVTQNAATEPAFSNPYWNNHKPGLYVDVVTGDPLFTSLDKFDSGTGWPSFTKPVDSSKVSTRTDSTLGMARTEVRSTSSNSHLGHLFDDGPAPTHQRYCMNSAALKFIPAEELEKQGYGRYAALFKGSGAALTAVAATSTAAAAVNQCTNPKPGEKAGCQASLQTAILAGGCFWGMEDILRTIPGVLETDVGYEGGITRNPTYEEVHSGKTGHAEAVRVVFDPAKISYSDLLEKWFFRMHDPTTPNQQGNDVGSQYRSAIFTTSPEQKKIAEVVKKRVNASGKWKKPVVTEIVEAGPFTPAESYHQDYLQKNPGGYTCHYLRK